MISIEKVLSEKGRLVVISFHSLEDRIVKNFIKENSIPLRKYDPKNPDKIFVYENRKVIKPSEYEVKKNRRSRSAKLRWVFRSSLKLSQLSSSHNFINYGGIEF